MVQCAGRTWKATTVDNIRTMAVLSVRRGCAFAGLAIVTVMFGLAADLLLAFRAGAVLTALAAAVLFWKAAQAPHQDYRRTELWIMLERSPDLPAAQAGRVINTVLQDVYFRHAQIAAVVASILWLVSLVLQLR